MNFPLSYLKGPKLLFIKKISAAIFIVLLTFIVSCNREEQKNPPHKIDLNSRDAVLAEAKKILGSDVQMIMPGNFDEDTTKEFIAGTEINKPDKWGIQFHLLKEKDNNLKDVFETDLLEGSFTGGMVKKENSLNSGYDLIYYNSLDYYLGSGGGEVFAYLIDFYKKQTYYSHLIIEKGRRISLYLSENETPEVKNYFLGIFKKDYPNLRVVDKDINLDN